MTESQPTTAEIARRLDREYEQLRTEMSAGFARLERAIERQRYVDPELFRVDQLRQDDATAELRGSIRDAWDASQTFRKQFVSGLLIVLVVAVVASTLTR